MSTEIVPFNFDGEQVRVVTIVGEPWFVLADICTVLAIRNVGDTASRLDSDVKGVATIDTLGGRQQVTVVSEPGMYEVVLLSRKPEARAFKRWITGTVLPEIRKTGSYSAPMTLEQRTLAIMGELTSVVQHQAQKIEVLEPKADAWDGLASGNGTYAVGDAAKMLQQVGIDTGRDRLFEYMRSIGWVFRQSGRWQASQKKAVDTGRLFHKPQSHEHPETGERVIDAPQVRVTMKGLNELRMLMLPPLPVLRAVEVGQ